MVIPSNSIKGHINCENLLISEELDDGTICPNQFMLKLRILQSDNRHDHFDSAIPVNLRSVVNCTSSKNRHIENLQ